MTDGAERRFARDPGRDDAGDGWGALRDAEPDRPRHAGSPWLRSPAREAALGGEVYSVRELSRQVRFLLEAHFPVVAVRGEVTNLSRPQSGHIYFSLVDDEGGSSASRSTAPQIPVVIWRSTSARQRFELASGMKVIVVGRLATYEARGTYQVVADKVAPDGIGELQLAFDALKAKLAAEGLFDPARKRPLPFLPRRIGLVTSPTGAALRDFLRVLADRYPGASVRISPARVQGEGAAEEIARALAVFEREPGDVEVIVLARGGGSVEDLWAFNEEVVARAIVRASVPVISAVGHEVDVTIADYAADVRAPTPTRAAELVVPDRRELFDRLRNAIPRLDLGIARALDRHRQAVDSLAASRSLQEPQVAFRERFETLERLARDLENHLYNRLRSCHDAVRIEAARLDSLSPLAVLSRGYAVVVASDGRMVRQASELEVGTQVTLRLSRGRAEAQVLVVEPDEPPRSGSEVGGPAAGRGHGGRRRREDP